MILSDLVLWIIDKGPQVGNIGLATWAAIVSAVAAVVALGISIWGVRVSKRAQRLAQRQDDRRKPSLALYLVNGFFQTLTEKGGDRIYAFLISISNTSDSDDSVASLDMNITLISKEGSQITFKVPCDDDLGDGFNSDARTIEIPIKIASHETREGWCYFLVNHNLLTNRDVERYQVVLTNSSGYRATIEPVLVTQLMREDEINERKTDGGSSTT